MPYKDPEKRRAASRERTRRWRERHPDYKPSAESEAKRQMAARLKYGNEPLAKLLKNKEFRKALRLDAMSHYGGAVCNCCGETQYEFLSFDHIDGGGREHRKTVGGGYPFLLWLKRNNWPDGFQVLCHNCNQAKGFHGSCPHVR